MNDFPYAPVPPPEPGGHTEPVDVVVATELSVSLERFESALRPVFGVVILSVIVDRAPVHWVRIRSDRHVSHDRLCDALRRAAVPLRYVASARRGSTAVPPPLAWNGRVIDDSGWAVRSAAPLAEVPSTPAWWFLGSDGISLDRRLCGTAAGTRLAVIDDDVADAEHLDLDATIPVGVERAARSSGHGALMVAWANGARRNDGTRFEGVAPGASVRLYVTPKHGTDVVSLAAAIVHAALDGADVIVCATCTEGATSPMLDDALEVATRAGRAGSGTLVVLPTGRETSSAPGHVHASLSLAFGDPASDPRVVCIAPSGRNGGWFLWRSRDGRSRPFANRGPAIRFSAPGDDIVYPFLARERFHHAESSGAAAIAAGVILLVVANNPKLAFPAILEIIARTLAPPSPDTPGYLLPLADPADLLPRGRDGDGHDAKHGYGRLHATRACLAARDPVALELLSMGEEGAARAWCELAAPWSRGLGAWMVKRILGDAAIEHASRAILRHGRLLAASPARARLHGPGTLARQMAVVLRSLGAPDSRDASETQEWADVVRAVCGATEPARAVPLESAVTSVLRQLWPAAPPRSGQDVGFEVASRV